MKKTKGESDFSLFKNRKENSVVMKINWSGTEYGSLVKLNQSTFQMEHFMSFNKLNV